MQEARTFLDERNFRALLFVSKRRFLQVTEGTIRTEEAPNARHTDGATRSTVAIDSPTRVAIGHQAVPCAQAGGVDESIDHTLEMCE